MKQIQAFKTEDGKVFENKAAATNHNQFLEIRGILQSDMKFSPTNAGRFTIDDFVHLLIKNGDKIKDNIVRYNAKRRSAKTTENVVHLSDLAA